MKIIDLLKKDAIELNTSVASKSDAIDKLVALHEKAGNLLDVNAYKDAILAREAQGSTAIGEGIAVPHAKSESVKHRAFRQSQFQTELIMKHLTEKTAIFYL